MNEQNRTEAFPMRKARRAAAVAALGMEYLKKGITTAAADLVPDYLRKSQAEREMEEKHGQMGQ